MSKCVSGFWVRVTNCWNATGVGVAQRKKNVAHQNQCDGREPRLLIGVAQYHSDSYKSGTVFAVKCAAAFDLAHFLARRNVDAERALDPLLLVSGRVEKVQPQRTVTAVDLRL